MRIGGRVPFGAPTRPFAVTPIVPTADVGGIVSGWTELTAPPTPFEAGTPNYAVALDDGTILVGAGNAATSEFWIYDPDTDAYTATASGPAGASYNALNAGAFVNGKAYAVSDSSTGNARYDGASWTTRAGRTGFPNVSAATDDTFLYTLDGAQNFQSYDPSGDSWTTLSSPSVGYGYDPLVCDGTSLWVFSGLAGVSQYDIGTDTWDSGSLLTDPPTPRSFVACGIIGGLAYLAGGFDSLSNPSDVLEIYDLTGDSWTTGPPMSTALTTASGAVLDGKLYVFGLTGSPSFTPTARVYQP